MRRFGDPAIPNPPEEGSPLGRGAPDAREQATESAYDSPQRAPTAGRRSIRKAPSGAGRDAAAALSLAAFPSWARTRRGADEGRGCRPLIVKLRRLRAQNLPDGFP
jgi:hypothetical protein